MRSGSPQEALLLLFGPAAQIKSRFKLFAPAVDRRQVVEGDGNLEISRPQAIFLDRQRLAAQFLGLSVPSLSRITDLRSYRRLMTS